MTASRCSSIPLRDALVLDAAAEIERISASIRETVFGRLRRKGAVIGVSGGIDSSVVACLCQRALGKDRVQVLLMPENDSSPDSLRLGRQLANELGVACATEDISALLDSAGCYERRDDAVRLVAPEFGQGFRFKLALPNLLDECAYSIFSIVVQSPDGTTRRIRLTAKAYLGIVAATNFKQRVRKMMEYYYADLLNYAVAGTPNRLEYELGFFVKNGDGAADFKPIAHLYKSQVYQLAALLGVPGEICRRPPTTDTYSLDQSQEEFYFMLPLEKLDLCLYAKDNGVPAGELAPVVEMATEKVEQMYAIIESKRRVAQYLHAAPFTVE